jgi:hypothetical protein
MAMRFNGDVCSCGAGDVCPILIKIDAKSNNSDLQKDMPPCSWYLTQHSRHGITQNPHIL